MIFIILIKASTKVVLFFHVKPLYFRYRRKKDKQIYSYNNIPIQIIYVKGVKFPFLSQGSHFSLVCYSLVKTWIDILIALLRFFLKPFITLVTRINLISCITHGSWMISLY